MNCIIVEDEPIAQEILEKYILQIKSLHLIATCSNAFEAISILHKQKIDLMFLDIKMPLLSGMDMLKTLDNPPHIILTTAFSEFAVESYEYNINDYLLKPISFERFLKSVNKLIFPDKINNFAIDKDEKRDRKKQFIFFKSDKKIYKFYHSEILCFEGYGNYVKIHVHKQNSILILDKLTHLEEILSSNDFLRVHKSYIVNLLHVKVIEGNMLKVGKQNVPISLTYKDKLMIRLAAK